MSSSSEIVLGDDGYFYFKDIMSMMPFDTYVRGEMDEETGKIVVSLPRPSHSRPTTMATSG